MSKLNIAILGATSHIAKGLIGNFLQAPECRLELYTKSPRGVRDFLGAQGRRSGRDCRVHAGYAGFLEARHDVVINCVGVGTLKKLQGRYHEWFTTTEEYDNLVLGFLRRRCPEALYVSFSSGAVYGRNLTAPAQEDSANRIGVNHIATEDYYGIARLNAETKHRAFGGLRIVDLRIFAYFSRFIDLSEGYFITDVLDSILRRQVLKTSSINMVRDYVHPKDLFSIIGKCIAAGEVNAAFDVVSAKTVEKQEILDFFAARHGLQYEVCDSCEQRSSTGAKNIYCSAFNRASLIGYQPEFSSMDVIEQESEFLLGKSA